MPPAAQPVNAATQALGMMYRKVRVEQVVSERGVAIVRDEQGFSTEVPYRVQPGRGRLPREGDYWYVDRSMGPWIFSSYIATDDADINSVPGDLVVEGGVLLKKGIFITEGASVTTGLYVGEGAHVVGLLHSVTGISTDGGLTVTGSITANGGITLPEGKYIIRGPVAAPAFQNGWGNLGGTFQTVRYIEYPDGTAGIIGVANGGTVLTDTVLFNIPTHLRPDGNHTFIVPSTGGRQAQISVQSDGDVVLQSPDAGTTWLGLTSCRWPVGSAY